MKILIVDKQSLEVLSHYEDSVPNQAKYGGRFGDANQTSHIICSPSLDPDCVSVEDQDGVLVAIEDEAKTAIKLERVWDNLRSLRDVKLTACDWTQLSDSPLNSQDKAAWASYRQELRDLPEVTVDPTSPVWPDEPDQQI